MSSNEKLTNSKMTDGRDVTLGAGLADTMTINMSPIDTMTTSMASVNVVKANDPTSHMAGPEKPSSNKKTTDPLADALALVKTVTSKAATETPTYKKLEAMLGAAEITKAQFDCLTELLTQDVVKALNGFELIMPGRSITTRRKSSVRELSLMSHVFNTAELMTLILSFLSAKHLTLHVQLSCRGFHDVVQSASLKRELFKAPDPKSYPMRLPFDMRGVRNARVSTNAIVIVPSKITNAAKNSKVLRETYTGQPPAFKLKLTLTLTAASSPTDELKKFVIESEQGLKYGDIFDQIDKMDEAGLVEEFKKKACLPGSDKMVFTIIGFPENHDLHDERNWANDGLANVTSAYPIHGR